MLAQMRRRVALGWFLWTKSSIVSHANLGFESVTPYNVRFPGQVPRGHMGAKILRIIHYIINRCTLPRWSGPRDTSLLTRCIQTASPPIH